MAWLKKQSDHVPSEIDWSPAILHCIAQPFIALDRQLKIVGVNPAMQEAFYKWTGVHLYVGQNYLEALPDESIPDRLKIYRRAFRGERISFEQDYTLDGEKRTFIVTYDPLISGNRILGIIGSAKDITLQKLEQRRLRETTQKFENAFDHTMIGMALTDMDGRFVQTNPALCQMVGYSSEELSKMTYHDLIHPDDSVRNQEFVDSLLSGKIKCLEIEKRYKKKDGSIIYVQLSCSLVRDDMGLPLLYVAAIQDISHRIESIRTIEATQENLRRQTEELARSNSELERFAYVASHDLQEPLRMIVSYLQFLDMEYRGNLSPQADEYLHFAVDGAKRMSILIRDLLTYSRVGRANLKRERVNLSEVVSEAIRNLDSIIRDSKAEIIIRNLPEILGDRYQMLRLFQNLLENSIKYRSERSLQIEISTSETADEYLMVVSDNGIGFDQKDAVRIFEIFQRLHDREKYPGSGIGLSIVQTIVHRHGGKIWAESTRGTGSKIFFTLPKQVPTKAVL